MTGRQRLQAVIRRESIDRLSWTTLVDENTLRHLPEDFQTNGGLDFYRHFGCDIFLLNGWSTQYHFQNPTLKWPDGVDQVRWQEDDRAVWEIRTPQGSIRAELCNDHPIKQPVTNSEELRIYYRLWDGAHYEWRNDSRTHAALMDAIGEDGIAVAAWGPSTIPRLLQYDMGTEAFYYLMQDGPTQMEELIRRMHQCELKAFEYLAAGPFDTIVLMENTSTYYISPDIYRRFNGPHVRDFVDVVHGAGKTAIIHMCGHVRNLLDDIRKTGLDGIHALTPPPTGDTHWELAFDELGEQQVIFGVLDPSIFISGPIEEIGPCLDALYTPRLRRAHFVLTLQADGIYVPLERFKAVARWMEKNADL